MTLTEIAALKRHQAISLLLESLGYTWDGSHFTRGNQKIAWERIKGRSVGTFVDETLQHDPTLLTPLSTQNSDPPPNWGWGGGIVFPFADQGLNFLSGLLWSPPLIYSLPIVGIGGHAP